MPYPALCLQAGMALRPFNVFATSVNRLHIHAAVDLNNLSADVA